MKTKKQKNKQIDYLNFFPTSVSVPNDIYGDAEIELSDKIKSFFLTSSYQLQPYFSNEEVVCASMWKKTGKDICVLGHGLISSKILFRLYDDEEYSDNTEQFTVDQTKHEKFICDLRDHLYLPLAESQEIAWRSMWRFISADDGDWYFPTTYEVNVLIIPELILTARNYGFVYR